MILAVLVILYTDLGPILGLIPGRGTRYAGDRVQHGMPYAGDRIQRGMWYAVSRVQGGKPRRSAKINMSSQDDLGQPSMLSIGHGP